MEEVDKIRKRISTILRKEQLSLLKLAKKTNLPYLTLYRLLNNKHHRRPFEATIEHISSVLDQHYPVIALAEINDEEKHAILIKIVAIVEEIVAETQMTISLEQKDRIIKNLYSFARERYSLSSTVNEELLRFIVNDYLQEG